jgi:hypothetical protein
MKSVPVLVSACHHELLQNRPSSRTVPAINGTRPPVSCDSRFAGRSLIMPPGPSRAGRKAYGSTAIEAFRLALRSDESAEMRQGNVSFGEAVAQDWVFLTRASKKEFHGNHQRWERWNSSQNGKSTRMFHHEMSHCIHSGGHELRTAALATVEKFWLR